MQGCKRFLRKPARAKDAPVHALCPLPQPPPQLAVTRQEGLYQHLTGIPTIWLQRACKTQRSCHPQTWHAKGGTRGYNGGPQHRLAPSGPLTQRAQLTRLMNHAEEEQRVGKVEPLVTWPDDGFQQGDPSSQELQLGLLL